MLIEGLMLLAASWSAAGPALPVRTLSVPHQGATLEVRYGAQVTIETRQIGVALPNRPGNARCLWRAVLAPERTVIGLDAKPVAALKRRFDGTVIADGSRHGACASGRRAIEAEVARASTDAVPARLAAFVERDVRTLDAELATLANLTRDAG